MATLTTWPASLIRSARCSDVPIATRQPYWPPPECTYRFLSVVVETRPEMGRSSGVRGRPPHQISGCLPLVAAGKSASARWRSTLTQSSAIASSSQPANSAMDVKRRREPRRETYIWAGSTMRRSDGVAEAAEPTSPSSTSSTS
eukprot:scaffold104593_cov69-Phaeocystis_antarctica.AAC.3